MTTHWVLLRGLTRDSRHWGGLPAALDAALPGARLHLIDLPGNGRLYGMASPLSVEAMAQDCRQQLRRRGLAPPFHVLAMSLGAMVAVAWAAKHPQELAGCVLMNTSMRPFSPFTQRLRPESYRSLLRLALSRLSDQQWEETVLRLTTRLAATTNEQRLRLLITWVRWRHEEPVTRMNALRQLVAAARFRAPRIAPGPRMLVLASEQDALVDVRCSRQLAAAWQCDLAVHPEAGHDLPLDDGAWVVDQVCKWMAAPVPAGQAAAAEPAPADRG